MKASALISRSQQIGMDHCQQLGLTKQKMQEANLAFLVSRIYAEFSQDINSGEELHAETKPFLPQKAIYHRHTSFKNKKGDNLVEIDTSWILVNMQNKTILRRPPQNFCLPFTDNQITHTNHKLHKVTEGVFLGEEVIRYSRCDANGHLNNAQYISIICDYLLDHLLTQNSIRRILITYHKEVLLKDRLKLYISRIQSNEYYIYGIKDSEKCFEANIVF